MCVAVSGITKSDGTVYMPDPAKWEHSHRAIAAEHNIPDGMLGDKYARWELTPSDGNYQSDIDKWVMKIDEQRTPGWWTDDAAAHEDKVRREVKRYMESANRNHVAPGAHASTTGDEAHASTTGDEAHASTTGDEAHASTTGDEAHASTTGNEALAVSTGYNGYVRSGNRGVLVCAERANNWELIGWAVGVVGKGGIKPHQWYKAERGKLVKVCDERTKAADKWIAEQAEAAKKGARHEAT